MDCSVAWCGNNHLLLNEAKTVDIAVNSRKTGTMLNTISTLEEEVEVAKYTETVYRSKSCIPSTPLWHGTLQEVIPVSCHHSEQ